ncbi:MAG: hypothetical protein ACRC2K_04350, partial [Clostridium sp.]
QIINEKLRVTKKSTNERVYSYKIIIYTILILNITHEVLGNLFFRDEIEDGARFIKNTVTINGVKKRCINPEEGFYIGNLKGLGETTITFKVLILPTNKSIKNQSSIEYDYIYNNEKPPLRVDVKSNNVTIDNENNIFKQGVASSSISIRNVNCIMSIKLYPEIVNTKIINSYVKNNANVLVIYKIKYKIVYKSKGKIKCLEDVFGFSEILVASSGIIYEEDIMVKIKMIHGCYTIDKSGEILINSVVLLYI